jgi:hypothetical protein
LSELQPPSGASDALAWIQERWVLIAGLALFLLVLWLASAEPRARAGRYLLVKDDVPCTVSDEGDGRRWCYVVLDTQTGELEERVRKLRRHDD